MDSAWDGYDKRVGCLSVACCDPQRVRRDDFLKVHDAAELIVLNNLAASSSGSRPSRLVLTTPLIHQTLQPRWHGACEKGPRRSPMSCRQGPSTRGGPRSSGAAIRSDPRSAQRGHGLESGHCVLESRLPGGHGCLGGRGGRGGITGGCLNSEAAVADSSSNVPISLADLWCPEPGRDKTFGPFLSEVAGPAGKGAASLASATVCTTQDRREWQSDC